jgi:adenosylcobyric acid synthase
MLGTRILDPQGIEGPAGDTPGLGLLDVETVMHSDKRLARVTAFHATSGLSVQGYEIHIGQTEGPDRARPFARIEGAPEGAMSGSGRVVGSYLHGLFSQDAFRAAYLGGVGIAAGPLAFEASIEAALDDLADHLEAHSDVAGLLALAR